jgi:hypothetical protein
MVTSKFDVPEKKKEKKNNNKEKDMKLSCPYTKQADATLVCQN